MLSLPHELRIANAAAVLHGPHGEVTHRASQLGLSRQALYRDTQAVLHTLEGHQSRQQFQQLRDEVAALQRRVAERQDLREDAFLLDDDRCVAFASTAQAEGVSLPVCRRLLAVLLDKPVADEGAPKRQPPSVAQLGRMTQEAGRRCAALLAVLDEFSRPCVEQAAADEIFFGRKPCLMVVEQHSLCWVSGRLAESRSGEEWAKEFRQLPQLRQTTQDGGSGLAKGLDLVNQARPQNNQAPVAVQDDPFHVLREGTRVLRIMQGKVSKLMDKADQVDRKMKSKVWHQGDGRGKGAAVQAWRRAERALDAWSAAATAWSEVAEALRLFTPQGSLNTAERARALIAAALPRLSDPAWSKVRRALQRPQLLTFLDAAQQGIAALPLPAEVLAAAVRVEGLCRRPEQLRGEGVSSGALRGVLLAAGLVLSLSGAVGTQAVTGARGVLRGVWRASSLVECINSVARMQQSRHRKMTQGLLDLKRLYWNCREFRTGHRRRKSPYDLQGMQLPTRDWWELLRWTPEQLRQQLQLPNQVAAAPPPQKVSGLKVAA
ncbi:MAG TPA: hypothetical protein VKU02_23725 [Gemmataceae bacterium]|nr:hypothetical protein [Gemmataceae bacterium]